MIKEIDKTTSLHLNNEAQFLCFTLEDDTKTKDSRNPETQLYAINVFKVREIIYYDGDLTETAGENNGLVLGFLTVRGESIPLIDMRRWLYYNPKNPRKDLRAFSVESSKSLVVICNFSNQDVGLKILGVKHIIHKSWGEINVGSEFGFDGDSKVTATTKYEDGSVIQILDVERMIVDAFPGISNDKMLEISNLHEIHSDKMVLIAEDSKSASKALEVILEKLGVKYMAFGNGRALLDYLGRNGVADTIGVIITDLEMPMVSGFEILRQVKNNPLTKNIPIIVNSSMSSDSNIELAQSLHADGFITKSDPKKIESYLRQFLTQS